MNEKYNVKYSDYNSVSKTSYVIITTYLGEFTGTAKLHEEDKDIESRFFGCEIAEMRAGLKFLKAQKKILKNEYQTLYRLNEKLNKMKDYNKDSLEARQLRKEMYLSRDKLNTFSVSVNNFADLIWKKIINYRQDKENFLQKIQNKKKDSI